MPEKPDCTVLCGLVDQKLSASGVFLDLDIAISEDLMKNLHGLLERILYPYSGRYPRQNSYHHIL